MTTQREHWQALFGDWSDHAGELPLWRDVESTARPFGADQRRMTVDEAVESAVEFALEIMQGYHSPDQHDDFGTPASDLLQGLLMELFVRDNRTARILLRGVRRLVGSGNEVTPRLHSERCENIERIPRWPFLTRCMGESVDQVGTGDNVIVLCEVHWNEVQNLNATNTNKTEDNS